MISYKANYEPVKRPYICKVFTASSGEEFHTALNYENESDRLEMSSELVYEHLDNCILYIQDRSKELKVIQLDEVVGDEPWPAVGWFDILWANNEINLWWHYAYYKHEAEKGVTVTIEHSHDHGEESDHTHDPVTGEEIPNA
jgi:hypothetical protein